MSELLSEPNSEQYTLGALLALMIDYDLDFETGYFDYDDLTHIAAGVVGALYEAGEVNASDILKDYGVLEEGQDEI